MLPAALDLSSLLPLVLTAIALVLGSLLVVKKAASKYFVVDASFETGEAFGGSLGHHRMSIGGGEDAACAVCGRSGTKKCSRCKRVRYCSTQCQSRHWEAEHKSNCKKLRSSDKVEIVSSGDDAYRRRKSSISLVPARGSCKVLQEPTKILFPYDEFVKLFYWDKPGFPPCGLLNCRNSCFANVVLQCLAFTRPLAAYLLEKDHSRACIRKQEDWCFLCELQAHVQRANQSRQPFSPINILSRIPNIGGNLGYGSQEDAHEFMRFAIDTMQSVCLDEHGGEKALDPSTQETTLIQHIFGGHLQSQVKCTKCNMISNRYENMMDLTVEIHGDAESLEECLDQFTVREWLDGDNMYKCDGCNGYVKAWKRLTVHQAPNILTIALKRFQSGRFGKLNKRVTFPEELDLSPYMSEDGDVTNLYSLYAVVVHVDMLNASFFGHYICYTKDYYGHWYRIDDCKVTIVDAVEVLSQGAYMLLYSRRTARREPFIKPIEPARKKHVASGDGGILNVPNGVNVSNDFASFPSSTSLESNSDLTSLSSNAGSELNLSLLRDTGHDRQTDAKTDTTMKGKEDLESEVSVEVTLSLVHKDLGDVDMIDSELCLLGPQGCGEESSSLPSHVQEDVVAVSQSDGNSFSPATPSTGEVRQMDFGEPNDCEGECSRQPSHIPDNVIAVPQTDTNIFTPATLSSAEIQYMECEEPLGISDANSHIKDNTSVCINGEVPLLSRYPPDDSISGQNTASNIVHNMAMTFYNASFPSSSSTESENSGDSKPEPVMAEHHPSSAANGVDKLANIPCRSEGTKALPPVSENGSFGKPKSLFSRGFLDKSPGEKSANNEKRTQREKPKTAASNTANGHANGQSKINNNANCPTFELTSVKSKSSTSDSGVAFIHRGALNGLYRKSAAELKIGQAKCRVPAEVALGSEAASSWENSSTSNNGTVYNKENGCRVCKKDATSRLEEDENSNGSSDCPLKLINGTCYQNEHVMFAESNGLATNYVEGECWNGE